MIRSHPLYWLAAVAIALGLQWTLSHRLRRSDARQGMRGQNGSDDSTTDKP